MNLKKIGIKLAVWPEYNVSLPSILRRKEKIVLMKPVTTAAADEDDAENRTIFQFQEI